MLTVMVRARWIATLLFLLSLFYLTTYTVRAATSIETLIIGQIQVWEDPTANATLNESRSHLADFTDLLTTSPNFGFTRSAYWLRIPVQNQDAKAVTYYLDIKSPLLSEITLHLVSHGALRETVLSGANVAGNMRPYSATTHVLPFQLAPDESALLYVRVHSNGMPLFIPFAITGETEIARTTLFGWLLNSAILSILGAMALYNAFVFSLLRSRTYLYYVLQVLFRMMIVTGTGGIGAAYLYPGNTWLGNEGVIIWTGLAFALMILFTRNFLGLGNYRGFDRWTQILILWAPLTSGISLLWSVPFIYINMSAMVMLYPMFCLLAGIITLRRGHTEARFFIIGQFSTWCAYILFSAMTFSLVPYHPLIYAGPMLGIVADALLLSFALADRIRILQRAQITAEEAARRNLEIRSDELEQLVAARTAEIKILQGILPICANCKKIRNDDGAWEQLEAYISHHSYAEFSHGICSDCARLLYSQLYHQAK